MATVADVMTTDVAAVRETTTFKRIVEIMADRNVSAVPVVNADGVPIGVVSEADLLTKTEFPTGRRHASLLDRLRHGDELAKAEGMVAFELMTSWPSTIMPEAPLAEAAGRMLHARIKRLLVVGEGNQLIGIVSRSDLLTAFLRPDEEIRREIADRVLCRQLAMDPLRFAVAVRNGVVTITGRVERRSQITYVEDLVRQVDGVVQLDLQLAWTTDDTGIYPAVPWIRT
jgi:CBS domain-containing protein